MVVVVFKIALRPDIVTADYEETAVRMAELVSGVPGFLGMDYAGVGGTEFVIARFESHEALATWRNHPDHLEAQRQGRERFFSHYRIEVCDEVRSYEFPTD